MTFTFSRPIKLADDDDITIHNGTMNLGFMYGQRTANGALENPEEFYISGDLCLARSCGKSNTFFFILSSYNNR